jgi:hypothetical protein
MPFSKKPTPPAPTVLTLTLNPDGSASLVSKRGELATLSTFTYSDLRDIIAAIQHGAAHLLEVEKNPPVVPNASAVATSPASKGNIPAPVNPIPEVGVDLEDEMAEDAGDADTVSPFSADLLTEDSWQDTVTDSDLLPGAPPAQPAQLSFI